MGVANTLPNFKSFTFDGENSRNYGVYITGKGVFNAPERNVEMVEIPGRNGAYALDKGNFNNIEVTYPAGIVAETEADFAEAVSNMRNFLCSRVGYVRLTDDYNPDEYRLAVYKSGLDVEHDALINGKFDLVFTCKPQRYLTSGEELFEVGTWGDTEEYSGDIATFESDGADALKKCEVALQPIQNLNGYSSPWVGGAGKNLLKYAETMTGWWKGTACTITDGVATLTGSSSDWNGALGTYKWDVALMDGTTNYVVSFDYKTTATCQLNVTLAGSDKVVDSTSYNRTKYQAWQSTQPTLPNSNGAWARMSLDSRTMSVANLTAGSGEVNSAFLQIYAKTDGSNPQIRNMQLEVGSTATAFTPWENICPISGRGSVDTSVTQTNIWDEAIEQGSISTSNGQSSSSTTRNISTNYIPIEPNTSYYLKAPANTYLFFYDANKTYIGYHGNPKENSAFIPSALANAKSGGGSFEVARYMKFRCDTATVAQGSISINYPSTDHDYHAYNGQTYTTTLGTTVYGGTLDVVSGELTVTHGMQTITSFNGKSSATANNMFYSYVGQSTIKKPSTDQTHVDIISNAFPTATSYSAIYNGTEQVAVGVNQNGTIFCAFGTNGISTLNDANTWVGNNNVTVVYELATPTTTTLTAQQINALLGTNNVWSSGGNVTIEVGHNPFVLTNPTPFPSRPLLEATGYGNINIGSDTVTIVSEPLGQIYVMQEKQVFSKNITATFNDEYANTGDTIRYDNNGGGYYVMFKGIFVPDSGTIASVNATIQMGNDWYNIPIIYDSNSLTYNLYTTCLDSDLVYGTSASTSCVAKYVFTMSDSSTKTVYVDPTFAYDGAHTITANQLYTLPTGWTVKSPTTTLRALVLNSTKSALGNPLYIDLDIGEAYKIENGVFVSVNNAVTIPPELPTLPSGNTTVSHSNTITKLDVKPRWWKV